MRHCYKHCAYLLACLIWAWSQPLFAQTLLPLPTPDAVYGEDCGNNLGFEDGNLTGWTGCHYDGTLGTCPVGQQFPGGCPSQCTSTSTTNGVCTCNGCGGGGTPPCKTPFTHTLTRDVTR